MPTIRVEHGGRLPLWVAVAIMPLLSFCSSGEIAATAAPPAPPPTAAAATGAAHIYINEVLAHTDEPLVDTIELYNPTGVDVELTGWCLSDNKDNLHQYCVPTPAKPQDRLIIDAGGYALFTAPELGFKLSEFGETVFLSGPGPNGLQLIDSQRFGVSPNGVSLGRYQTSTGAVHFPLQRERTLGRANAGPYIPSVVISALMYDPKQGPEYLILTNAGNLIVPLYDADHPDNHWRVAGIDDKNGAYSIPGQVTLQPNESIVLTADPAAFLATYPASNIQIVGPFLGKLSNEGERVVLQLPQPPEVDGNVSYADMDAVEYGVSAPWPEIGGSRQALLRRDLQQYGDDPSDWRAGLGGPRLDAGLMLPLVQRGSQ